MKQEKSNATDGLASKSGSANLLSELQQIFAIYAEDLKTFRVHGTTQDEEGESTLKLLHNTDMFDMVVKLLNVSDKIKKLDTVDEEGEDKPKPGGKVLSLQDVVLKDKKA